MGQSPFGDSPWINRSSHARFGLDPVQLGGIGDDVDLGDPSVGHYEADDGDRTLSRDHDYTRVEDLRRDGLGAFHRRTLPRRQAARVEAEGKPGSSDAAAMAALSLAVLGGFALLLTAASIRVFSRSAVQ